MMDKIKAALTKPVSSAENPEQPKNQESQQFPSELDRASAYDVEDQCRASPGQALSPSDIHITPERGPPCFENIKPFADDGEDEYFED